MWIYIINFALLLLYGIFIKNKKILVAVSAIQLFLVLALKDPLLGADNLTYKIGYEYIATLDFKDILCYCIFVSIRYVLNQKMEVI